MTETTQQTQSPEHVIQIRRCACVVKGGRRFSFSALVVVGDRQGRVGWGYAKATEVPHAVDKAVKSAERRMVRLSLSRKSHSVTIPHNVTGHFGASKVLLLPASAGTGVIAGGCVRAVLDSAGITDVLSKSQGSTNPLNLVKATFDALAQLQSLEEVARLRGVRI